MPKLMHNFNHEKNKPKMQVISIFFKKINKAKPANGHWGKN
jgi:hypothetical protein